MWYLRWRDWLHRQTHLLIIAVSQVWSDRWCLKSTRLELLDEHQNSSMRSLLSIEQGNSECGENTIAQNPNAKNAPFNSKTPNTSTNEISSFGILSVAVRPDTMWKPRLSWTWFLFMQYYNTSPYLSIYKFRLSGIY